MNLWRPDRPITAIGSVSHVTQRIARAVRAKSRSDIVTAQSNTNGSRDLFPTKEADANVVEARKTGILPYAQLKAMVQAGAIRATAEFESDQFQPAS